MGCFSWLCNHCGKGIESDSCGGGQKCRLYLIKEGRVIEEIRGTYDSYGGVYTDQEYYQPTLFTVLDRLGLSKHEDETRGRFCTDWIDMHFDEQNSDGMAAVHEKCFIGEIPTGRCADDPNQGWGDEGKNMGNTDVDYDDE